MGTRSGPAPATPTSVTPRAPVTGPRGAPVTFTHQRTSKRALAIGWEFPIHVSKAQQVEPGRTGAAPIEQPLSREEAFACLSKGDQRPLLVMRECQRCQGSDDALLSRRLKNEDTQLLARFFHCVKLPVNVLEKQHALHELFAGDLPPHLFLSSYDGSHAIAMRGTYTQGDLWKAMHETLAREYVREARVAVKELVKLLAHFDHLDSLEVELSERIERETAKSGSRSARVEAYQTDLADLETKRQAALAKEQQLLDLGLKSQAGTAAR